MPEVDISLINKLTAPGPRIPFIKNWLINNIWTQQRYQQLGPLKYLQDGELEVNNLEKIISSTADRIYGEFIQANDKSKDIIHKLSNSPTAVVVFDGMSIRELPILISLAEKSGMKVVENDYSLSAIPSETITFVQQKLNCPAIGPSQLPTRRDIRDKGIEVVFLSSHTQQLNVNSDAKSLLVWSSFPDNTYADAGARFDQHFVNICHQIETAWLHSIQQIKKQKQIIITSDHGYIFFDVGLSFERSPKELQQLNNYFGNERSKAIENETDVPLSDDIFKANDSAMVKGRVRTFSTGQAANRLYRHGGMSLMECFVPWLVLERE